jgi:hypothetical protein
MVVALPSYQRHNGGDGLVSARKETDVTARISAAYNCRNIASVEVCTSTLSAFKVRTSRRKMCPLNSRNLCQTSIAILISALAAIIE